MKHKAYPPPAGYKEQHAFTTEGAEARRKAGTITTKDTKFTRHRREYEGNEPQSLPASGGA